MEVIVIVLIVASLCLFLARYAVKHIGADILCLVTGLSAFVQILNDTSIPESQMIVMALPVIFCILASACYLGGIDTKRV